MLRLVLIGLVSGVLVVAMAYCASPATTYSGCPDTDDGEWKVEAVLTYIEPISEHLYSVAFETESGCVIRAIWYTARDLKLGLQLLLKGRTSPSGDVEIHGFVVLSAEKEAMTYRARLGRGSWALFRGEPRGFQFPDLGNRLETAKVA